MTTLVTGATGQFGAPTCRFLAARGHRVLAMTRDPERATELTSNLITGVVGDLDAPETVRPHLMEADRVLLCTPLHARLAERESALIRMAEQCDVELLVKIIGSDRGDFGVPDRRHRAVLKTLRESNLHWALISPQSTMESDLLAQVEPVQYLGQLLGAAGGGRIGMVAADDCAEAAALVLDSDRVLFDERTLEITGPDALTYAEIADQLGRGLGRSVHYTDFDEVDFRKLLLELGMDEAAIEPEVLEHFRRLREGRADRVTDTFEWLTGRPPQTVADWARANRGTFAEALPGMSRN